MMSISEWKNRMINPVLEKEFRLRMRSIRAPLSLMFYLLAIGFLALAYMYIMLQNSYMNGINPDRSRELFYFLSGAQLILITFMVPGLTAGAISGEREKQTLNLLLTTQQSSLSIIASKLLASISFMMLIVFATLPLYSVVFLYGGISPAELATVFIFYIFVMLVLGAVGIACSTLFKRTVVAVIVSYGFVLFIYGFTAIGSLFLYELFKYQSSIPGIFLSLNPMAALINIFQPDATSTMFGPNTSLRTMHIFFPFYTILSTGCILVSVRYLRPVIKRVGFKKKCNG